MAVQNGKTCKELATSYIALIDSKARGYCQVRVIFDNYTKEASMKEQTRERRKGKVCMYVYIYSSDMDIYKNYTVIMKMR